MKNSIGGFTLIEMSIVLVIIGLIVGGILVGRDLVRAAELRTIMQEVEQFNAATNTFMDKYGGLPGDLANATQFFSSTDCADYGTQSCNGDGNGIIAVSAGGSNETFRYWQHLALAGLIAGKYTGWPTDATVAGVDTPASRAKSNATYFLDPQNGLGYGGWFNYYGSKHAFLFGTPVFAEGTIQDLTRQEALQLDTKFDDGLPVSGSIRAAGGEWFNCQDGTNYLPGNDLQCFMELLATF